MKDKVLLTNGFVEISSDGGDSATIEMVATLVNNMSFYGFAPSKGLLDVLHSLSLKSMKGWWSRLEPVFKDITAQDRNMGDFVVYKNFPKEVLEKSEAEYWVSQILMYLGLPNEHFSEEVRSRPSMLEGKTLKVVSLASDTTCQEIWSSLIKTKAKWSDQQLENAKALVDILGVKSLSMEDFSFRENGVVMIDYVLEDASIACHVQDATDVLRLAAHMSGGDASLRTPSKFKNFTRHERRMLLGMLEGSKNPKEDMAMRKEQWKRLLRVLHPNDYACPRVVEAYGLLYNGGLRTFQSIVDEKVRNIDASVFKDLSSRPGDFLRSFHRLYSVFGKDVVTPFTKLIPKLTNQQLVRFKKYILTINGREMLIYPPRGNWTKAQFVKNEKVDISEGDITSLVSAISSEMGKRLGEKLPMGVSLSEDSSLVKLQTNGQELASYGRGTVFKIPENIKFMRSASFWKRAGSYGMGNTWYDNGWNFFDENWSPKWTCCWNSTSHKDKGSVFSGDPTNSKDMEGRACQMIDLYLDNLLANGVRYAVWNILAYSGIPFSKSEEVLATLQWGEDAETGSLYEPSRAQMVFPLKGDNLTKYVAFVDLEKRELVYMDANLSGNRMSARSNDVLLSQRMPAFIEYLNSLPSVLDLFSDAKEGVLPVLYTDDGVSLPKDSLAYVFKRENKDNDVKLLDLTEILEK